MFSATVSDGTRRASWNERPRPSQARLSGPRVVTSSPSKSMRPGVGGEEARRSRSKMVVLPAPLGPMSPRISCSWSVERWRRRRPGCRRSSCGPSSSSSTGSPIGVDDRRARPRSRRLPARATGGGRGPLEEHRADDVVALEQLGGGTLEADLALLEEVGPLGDGEGDVDRLLDQDDRGAARPGCGARCRAAARRWSGARPSDSSSIISSFGLAMKAMPRASICCSPPDRLPAIWSLRSRRRGKIS